MSFAKKCLLDDWGRKPPVLYMVEIEFDEMRLVKLLGERALKNKTKRSRLLNKLITARIRPIGEQK